MTKPHEETWFADDDGSVYVGTGVAGAAVTWSGTLGEARRLFGVGPIPDELHGGYLPDECQVTIVKDGHRRYIDVALPVAITSIECKVRIT